ncbi:unnamed protein product [Symbiodinium sp. KB8]|nr:unnamed protein product [Symbiodinium sp. KB8]
MNPHMLRRQNKLDLVAASAAGKSSFRFCKLQKRWRTPCLWHGCCCGFLALALLCVWIFLPIVGEGDTKYTIVQGEDNAEEFTGIIAWASPSSFCAKAGFSVLFENCVVEMCSVDEQLRIYDVDDDSISQKALGMKILFGAAVALSVAACGASCLMAPSHEKAHAMLGPEASQAEIDARRQWNYGVPAALTAGAALAVMLQLVGGFGWQGLAHTMGTYDRLCMVAQRAYDIGTVEQSTSCNEDIDAAARLTASFGDGSLCSAVFTSYTAPATSTSQLLGMLSSSAAALGLSALWMAWAQWGLYKALGTAKRVRNPDLYAPLVTTPHQQHHRGSLQSMQMAPKSGV